MRLLPFYAILAVVGTPRHPAQWVMEVSPQSVTPGTTLTARLSARIDRHWHLYSMTQPKPGPNGGPAAMRIAILPDSPFELTTSIRAPAPDTIPDTNFGILTQSYSDSVTLTATARVKAGTAAGNAQFAFAITYMTCTARVCMPARTDTVTTMVRVADPKRGDSPVRPRE